MSQTKTVVSFLNLTSILNTIKFEQMITNQQITNLGWQRTPTEDRASGEYYEIGDWDIAFYKNNWTVVTSFLDYRTRFCGYVVNEEDLRNVMNLLRIEAAINQTILM